MCSSDLQAAIWASMDAMNAQFLQQQEAWMAQQREQQQRERPRGYDPLYAGIHGLADKAKVKRNKKRKPSASSTGTKLSIGGSGGNGSGVSMGGAASGKTLGVG